MKVRTTGIMDVWTWEAGLVCVLLDFSSYMIIIMTMAHGVSSTLPILHSRRIYIYIYACKVHVVNEAQPANPLMQSYSNNAHA